MTQVDVDLGARSYPITIESGLLDRAGSLIAQCTPRSMAVVITNTTVGPLYCRRLEQSLRTAGIDTHCITLPDGEQHKTLTTMADVYRQLADLAVDRRTPIVALGGGVIGDMAGFAAATFLRGVPFINIPTTLLAQVDSSVGGKTGVNLPAGKNLVGAFYQPTAVLIDPDVLHTLPARQFRAGIAEVIKYGAIMDPALAEQLQGTMPQVLARDPATLAHVIAWCCRLKAQVTGADETEHGLRAILNFGHTIGHAIETLGGYDACLHGEAVAIGMVAAARISVTLGMCAPAGQQQLEQLVRSAELPPRLPPFTVAQYLDVIMRDKKRARDTINFILLHEIGSAAQQPLDAAQIEAQLETLLCAHPAREEAP